MIGLDDIDRLTGGKLGEFDVGCPLCGPHRRTARGQRKRVLRVWRVDEGFATFYCARCVESGYAHDPHGVRPDPEKLAKARAEADARARTHKAERLRLARWLWSRRQPIIRSIAETYLRSARCYSGPLPATLGFLPARGEHLPAMIAAFGLAHEVEPGTIAIRNEDVVGVHLTRLMPDGSGKAAFDDPDESAKIMVGFSTGSPIVLAPPSDALGLVITEGIERGLFIHHDTGLGVWCAGAASRMPALAPAVPAWIDFVTVVADDDKAGRQFSAALADELRGRGMAARAVIVRPSTREAA
jgi:Toprim domain